MIEIIAEIGVNHNGSLENALLLADEARRAGANIVKTQLFSAERLKRPELKALELPREAIRALKGACEDMGLEFLCTPFDTESVAFLAMLGVKRIKVASGCIRRLRLLEAIEETKLPVILSTGMAMPQEVADAMLVLGFWRPAFHAAPIDLLHCCSAYPAPLKDVNLRAMEILRHQYRPRSRVGFSDHTQGITVAIAAVGMGAQLIEKHLTLDRNAPGPDHKASIEPDDFRVMVNAIRDAETALGEQKKFVTPSEEALRKLWP